MRLAKQGAFLLFSAPARTSPQPAKGIIKPVVYSVPQRVLHWVTAALILYSLLLPGQIERVADLLGGGKEPSPTEWNSANLHIYIGFAVLGLTLLRLVLRLVQGAPEAPASEPAALRAVAAITHGAIYLVILAMPAAGIAKFYFGIGIAGFIHGGPMKLALWILVALHVAGALVHKFYWRTDVLERMTSGRVKSSA